MYYLTNQISAKFLQNFQNIAAAGCLEGNCNHKKRKSEEIISVLKIRQVLTSLLIWELHFDFLCIYRRHGMKNDNKLGRLN